MQKDWYKNFLTKDAEQFSIIKKNVQKWAWKYLKMVSSRGREAVKRFVWWENRRGNTKNIFLKMKQLNGSYKTVEQKK